jgi:hypothetical protein
LSSELVDGEVKYATSHIKARNSTTSCNNVAPKVALPGKKIDCDEEFELTFGAYYEVYDPQCQSNNALEDRNEPCVAFYPANDSTESWPLLPGRRFVAATGLS